MTCTYMMWLSLGLLFCGHITGHINRRPDRALEDGTSDSEITNERDNLSENYDNDGLIEILTTSGFRESVALVDLGFFD